MSKIFFSLFCCLCLLAPAFSQEQTAPDEPTDAVVDQAATEEAPAGDAEDEGQTADGDEASEDDSDLDRQTYEENDDVFVPSEEIPSDEPIPFPSDI